MSYKCNTMSDSDDMVAFRLPRADRAAIQRLVEQGRFHNRSDFFRHAVKMAIRDYGEPAAPSLPNLEMESVDLPDSAPATRARRAGQRPGKGVTR